MRLSFILDAPSAPADGATTSTHPIARLGRYTDPRYGKFAITRAQFQSWKRNLAEIQNGRIPIDYDHHAELAAGSTKAAGWITALNLTTGAALKQQDPERFADLDSGAEYALATIEWTPEGAQAVRDRYWLFVSPTFQDSYDDEQGHDCGPTLVGVALTNRPFLRRGMPAISLSAVLEDAEAPAAVTDTSEPPSASDSRGDMSDFFAKLREALALGEDADEAAVLDAITKQGEQTKLSLDQRAKADGKVLLTTSEHAKLVKEADKAEGLAKRLSTVEDNLKTLEAERHAQIFTLAYDKALGEGRLTSDDETRADWQELYSAAPDLTLKRLAALPVSVKTSPTGETGDTGAPEGMDPARFQLAIRARQIMAEKNIPYIEALGQAQAAQEA